MSSFPRSEQAKDNLMEKQYSVWKMLSLHWTSETLPLSRSGTTQGTQTNFSRTGWSNHFTVCLLVCRTGSNIQKKKQLCPPSHWNTEDNKQYRGRKVQLLGANGWSYMPSHSCGLGTRTEGWWSELAGNQDVLITSNSHLQAKRRWTRDEGFVCTGTDGFVPAKRPRLSFQMISPPPLCILAPFCPWHHFLYSS